MNRRGIFCGVAGLLGFGCLGIAMCTIENVVADAQEGNSPTTTAEASPVTNDARTTADAPESHRAISVALNRKGAWDFEEVPLKEVITFVRSTSKIDTVIDFRALVDMGIGTDTPITCHQKDISLRSFLRIVLGELGLTHEIRNGALWITTKEAAEANMSVRTYAVGDLIRMGGEFGEPAYDCESLMDLIRGFLEPESWGQFGGPGAIDAIYGTLVVSHVGEVHERLTQFLAAYRQVIRQHKENPDGSGSPVFVDDSLARTKILAALESQVTLELQDVPLTEATQFLAKTTGIPIVIDTRALHEWGIPSNVPVTARINQVPLRFALHRLLDPHELTWTVRNEVFSITTFQVSESHLLTCLYPVYTLVAPHADAQPEDYDFDTLIGVLEGTVQPDSWDDVGGPSSIGIIESPPCLVISQSESVHVKLRVLLKKLHLARQIELKQLSSHGASRALIRTYSMQRGHDARSVLEMAVRFMGEDIYEGEGVVIDVLGNAIVVRHNMRGHRRIESMLSRLGAWYPHWRGGKGGGGFGRGGGGGFGGGGGGGFGGGGNVEAKPDGKASGGVATPNNNGGLGGFF